MTEDTISRMDGNGRRTTSEQYQTVDGSMPTEFVRAIFVSEDSQTEIIENGIRTEPIKDDTKIHVITADYSGFNACVPVIGAEMMKHTVFDEKVTCNTDGTGVEDKVIQTKTDMESMHAESKHAISALQSYNKALIVKTKKLENMVDDLMSTNNHLKSEMMRMSSVDVTGIVKSMMEFAARVNNFTLDYEDLDQLKGSIQSNIEMLISDLGSYGLEVSVHERGSMLPDNDVEIDEKTTVEQELDSKICRTTRFGASFKNDVYPRIDERVTAYRYREQ